MCVFGALSFWKDCNQSSFGGEINLLCVVVRGLAIPVTFVAGETTPRRGSNLLSSIRCVRSKTRQPLGKASYAPNRDYKVITKPICVRTGRNGGDRGWTVGRRRKQEKHDKENNTRVYLLSKYKDNRQPRVQLTERQRWSWNSTTLGETRRLYNKLRCRK